MNLSVLLIVIGVVVILLGAITLKYPNLEWKLSIRRMLYMRKGEPTSFYYTMQKIGAVFSIIMGVIIILHGIGRISADKGIGGNADKNGFIVYINNEEIHLPCQYEDIAAIGFELCQGEKVGKISSNGRERIKVVNSNGQVMEIYLINRTGSDVSYDKCEVHGFSVDYKTQTYDISYGDGGNPINGNYTAGIVSTEVEEGPRIKLKNGFSSTMSKEEVEKILGKGQLGVTGDSSKYFGVFSGVEAADITVYYGGIMGNDEISSINIECFK